MKALVISGGGSKGAFGGGMIQYLIQDQKKEYDFCVGSSTGCLLGSLAIINKIDELKAAYTSITQKEIYKISPFKIKNVNPNGNIEYRMRYFVIMYNFILNHLRGNRDIHTLGDSSNIRKLIRKFFTEEYYNELQKSGKQLVCCTSNMTLEVAEYKSSKDYSYEDICDYMQASAAAVPFMSYVKKNGYEYADGGFFDPIPINKAIEMGATELDVIVLSSKSISANPPIGNVLQVISFITDMMLRALNVDDLTIGKLLDSTDKKIKINFYSLPTELTNNSLLFDKNLMTSWWKQGYEFAKLNSFKSYEICNSEVKMVYDGFKNI